MKRGPLQGVWNIVRFNWPFYVLAGAALAGAWLASDRLDGAWRPATQAVIVSATLAVVVSLAASWYIYDLSNLYQLPWLNGRLKAMPRRLLAVNAGFDETSDLLRRRFPAATLTICDFYDPERHTEASIRRARAAYPPPCDTVGVGTEFLPFADATFDAAFAILAAHEIRDHAERVRFFVELKRVTRGPVFVTEHLRDWPNFMAYTFGFFHFHSLSVWKNTFREAGLKVLETQKTTPFITTFILEQDGVTP